VDVFSTRIRSWKLQAYHLSRLTRRVQQRICGAYRSNLFPSFYATAISRLIEEISPDVVIAAAISDISAHLRVRPPFVHWSDATTSLIQSGYDYLHSYSSRQIEIARQLDRQSARKSALALYSSEWAANAAISEYGLAPERTWVAPFGANISPEPNRARALQIPSFDTCRLLFIGKEWARKGGDLVIAAAMKARDKGVPVQLTIIGCKPPEVPNGSWIKVIKYLDKNSAVDVQQLHNLYYNSHFFFLPSRADCSPIVLCEANAFGVPVISARVGGIPSIILDGQNGFTLPADSSAEEFADVIVQAWTDPELYASLRHASRARYESALNWKAWADSVEPVLQRIVTQDTR
jgi:glycosyltransferase involved in cell wall biosynthesis